MKVLFWIRKQKVNARGLAPLYCRITIDGIRANDFSTGLYTSPESWNAGRQRCKDEITNSRLRHLAHKIDVTILELQATGADVTPQLVADIVTGRRETRMQLLQLFDLYIAAQEKRRKLRTISKYNCTRKILASFLKRQKCEEIPAEKFTMAQARDLQHYCSHNLKHSPTHSNRLILQVKAVLQFGVQQGHTATNPIFQWRGEMGPCKEIITLSEEQLQKLAAYKAKCPRLQIVADLFLFQCYTGLDYGDTQTFDPAEHIRQDPDGRAWIIKPREKNGETAIAPLLPEARKILDKYRMLPPISNQKYNAYLKEICLQLALGIHLTSHVGRKTFGTIMLNRGASIEAVSRMLGHRFVSTTQKHYARVNENLVKAVV